MTDIEQAQVVEIALGGHKPKGKGNQLVLVIEEDGGPSAYGGFYHINAKVGVSSLHPQVKQYDINDYGFAMPSYSTEEVGGLLIKNLTVTSQGDADSRPQGRLYAWAIGYRADSAVTVLSDVEKLEKMTKTLKAIQRRMTSYSDRFGSPQSFPQYLAYFANAIGANEFAIRPNRTGSYSLKDVKYGVYAVEHMINKWKGD